MFTLQYPDEGHQYFLYDCNGDDGVDSDVMCDGKFIHLSPDPTELDIRKIISLFRPCPGKFTKTWYLEKCHKCQGGTTKLPCWKPPI